MNIRRMWVNQPSERQPFHYLHGTNVLAVEEDDHYRIYFLNGDVISMQASRLALSIGWQ